jgi:hypothetical protein
MKVGSLVQCVTSFEDLRAIWHFDYPIFGEILTVTGVDQHHVPEFALQGIVLLHFDERRGPPSGICNKDCRGNVNFIEVVPPINLEAVFEQSMEKV